MSVLFFLWMRFHWVLTLQVTNLCPGPRHQPAKQSSPLKLYFVVSFLKSEVACSSLTHLPLILATARETCDMWRGWGTGGTLITRLVSTHHLTVVLSLHERPLLTTQGWPLEYKSWVSNCDAIWNFSKNYVNISFSVFHFLYVLAWNMKHCLEIEIQIVFLSCLHIKIDSFTPTNLSSKWTFLL